MVSLRQLNVVSQVLQTEGITLSDLLCAYIHGIAGQYELTGHAYALREELCHPNTLNKIVRTLLTTPKTSATITCIARNITVRSYILEMGKLLVPSAGFHFNVAHAAPSQFHQFSSIKMAKTFEDTCPTLWQLFGVLLNVVAVQNAAGVANNRGDYLTEITYRDGEDMPAPHIRRPQATDQTTLNASDYTPDEDWGRQTDDEDSSDEAMQDGEERIAADTEAAGGSESLSPGVWKASSGAPWQLKTGSAVQRQQSRVILATSHTVQCMHE